jgi:predicted nucleotidyltransferase component of viral defense system
MLSKDELRRYSVALGLTLGQTELDYVHHQVLSVLGRSSMNEWAFKGGTCLQKVFGLDRFSEDLDFTMVGDTDIRPTIAKVVDALGLMGLASAVKWPRSAKGRDEGVLRLRIEGPLFNGKDLSRCSVLFNISRREGLMRIPMVTRVVPAYPDIRPYLVNHMDPQEMLSEKVRAMLKRDKARDLYDVAFLIQKGIVLDGELVREKLSLYSLELTRGLIHDMISRKEPLWEKELKPLVHGTVPRFKATAEMVKEALGRLVKKSTTNQ